MPIRSDDFLLVAQRLPEGSEPFDRSAVSRLYYAVFHQARELLQRRGLTQLRRFNPITGSLEGSHQAVIGRLEDIDQNAAEVLEELRQRRVFADYDLDGSWDAAWRAEAWELVNYLRDRFGTR